MLDGIWPSCRPAGVDIGAAEDLPSEEELLAPDLTPAELADEPVLEDAQSSPTAGLDAESLERSSRPRPRTAASPPRPDRDR